MRILVASYSLSGNTKKIANAIYEELDSHDVEVHNKDLAEITPSNFNDYELIFLGSLVMMLILQGLYRTPSKKFQTHRHLRWLVLSPMRLRCQKVENEIRRCMLNGQENAQRHFQSSA